MRTEWEKSWRMFYLNKKKSSNLTQKNLKVTLGKLFISIDENIHRNTEEVALSALVMRFFMPVFWRTLGRCWIFSCVRGDAGECWWPWLWADKRPLLCSVPTTEFFLKLRGNINSMARKPFYTGNRLHYNKICLTKHKRITDKIFLTWSPYGSMLHCCRKHRFLPISFSLWGWWGLLGHVWGCCCNSNINFVI